MAYCIIGDVYDIGVHGATTFTASSTPTITQVNSAIDRVALRIDSELFVIGVSVPVVEATSPDAYKRLKDLNAIGAAAEAEAVAWNEQEDDSPDDSFTPGYFRKLFNETLKQYCEYPKKLIDAVLSATHPNAQYKEGEFGWSGIYGHYDYSYMDDKGDDYVKPLFRLDDIW